MQLEQEKKRVNKKLWKKFKNLKDKKNKYLSFMKEAMNLVWINYINF